MWVNNELGTVEPIREIGELCQDLSVLFHTDAVQAAGHVPIDVQANYIDALSMSGHKFGSPLGIGALYISDKVRTNMPLIVGGGQERGLRAGTENVAGIVGMGVAAEYAMRTLDDHRDMWKTYRELMLEGLSELLPGQFTVNGGDEFSSILSLTFPGVQSESLLLLLDQEDVYVSAGAACSAGAGSPSHVLTAIGLSDELAACTIRISMGFETTQDEVIEATKKIARCVEQVKAFHVKCKRAVNQCVIRHTVRKFESFINSSGKLLSYKKRTSQSLRMVDVQTYISICSYYTNRDGREPQAGLQR